MLVEICVPLNLSSQVSSVLPVLPLSALSLLPALGRRVSSFPKPYLF